MEVLLFGGTAEGRQLVEWLDARATCQVVVSTATEYGTSLISGASERVLPLAGPLSARQKGNLMRAHDFCCIVDATHPFAQHISGSINELAAAHGLEVVRVEREGADEGPWTGFSTMGQAARHVAGVAGNVLLTTGSKDLATFVGAMPDYAQRLYVRVLPVQASLQRALDLGIPASHIVAMQGPFSARLNAALIDELNVSCMVTKQSGTAGGFDQKVQAAQECGIQLVVVRRPRVQGGMSLQQAKATLEERYGL